MVVYRRACSYCRRDETLTLTLSSPTEVAEGDGLWRSFYDLGPATLSRLLMQEDKEIGGPPGRHHEYGGARCVFRWPRGLATCALILGDVWIGG